MLWYDMLKNSPKFPPNFAVLDQPHLLAQKTLSYNNNDINNNVFVLMTTEMLPHLSKTRK